VEGLVEPSSHRAIEPSSHRAIEPSSCRAAAHSTQHTAHSTQHTACTAPHRLHCLAVSCLSLSLLGVLLSPVSAVFAQRLPDGEAAREELRRQARIDQLRERYERGADVRLEQAVDGAFVRLPEGERPCVRVERLALDGEAWRRFRWALKAVDVKGDRARGRCLGREGGAWGARGLRWCVRGFRRRCCRAVM